VPALVTRLTGPQTPPGIRWVGPRQGADGQRAPDARPTISRPIPRIGFREKAGLSASSPTTCGSTTSASRTGTASLSTGPFVAKFQGQQPAARCLGIILEYDAPARHQGRHSTAISTARRVRSAWAAAIAMAEYLTRNQGARQHRRLRARPGEEMMAAQRQDHDARGTRVRRRRPSSSAATHRARRRGRWHGFRIVLPEYRRREVPPSAARRRIR